MILMAILACHLWSWRRFVGKSKEIDASKRACSPISDDDRLNRSCPRHHVLDRVKRVFAFAIGSDRGCQVIFIIGHILPCWLLRYWFPLKNVPNAQTYMRYFFDFFSSVLIPSRSCWTVSNVLTGCNWLAKKILQDGNPWMVHANQNQDLKGFIQALPLNVSQELHTNRETFLYLVSSERVIWPLKNILCTLKCHEILVVYVQKKKKNSHWKN